MDSLVGAFIVVGGLAMFRVLPGVDSDKAEGDNLVDHGGFLALGTGASLTGVLLVVLLPWNDRS